MTQIIVMGGIRHVVGNKTNYQIDRFEKWYKKDPTRAVNDILGNSDIQEIKNKKDILQKILKSFKLGITCIQFLGFLHEQIVILWLKIIDEWIKNNPNKLEKFAFKEEDNTYPPNYTKNMTRLKNIRFTRWNHENISGFCPLEPQIRLEQLLDFPIEIFDAQIKLNKIVFDDSPSWPDEILQLKNNTDLKKIVIELHPEIRKWEIYYDGLCTNLKDLCNYLIGVNGGI